MPNEAKDPIDHRVAQLDAISARRNELLNQMYQLWRQRKGLGYATQDSNEEGEDLQSFLSDFDLYKPAEQGFIQHQFARFLKQAGDSPISSALKVKTLSPSATGDAKPSSPSKSQAGERDEESEDDQDELDLIGNSQSAMDESEDTANQPSKSSRNGSLAVADGETRESVPVEGMVKQEEHADEDMNVDAQPSSEPAELAYPNPPPTLTTEGTKDALFVPVMHTPMVVGSHHSHLQQQVVPKTEAVPDEPIQPDRPALKATATEVGISPALISGQRSPIMIPAPLEPSTSVDPIVELTALPEHGRPPPATAPYDFNNPNLQYTLPPTSILPPEFSNRKKASKRKKDRSERKSDDLPMGLNRWAATLNANPVFTRVRRATKCLTTRDWSLAIAELRLIRTVERIEKLKQEGRWGFRQTKKQRGVGGLMKTHWDYLMDEMKWMRTDFREERKWKLALAYNLSTSVLEWHALTSWEERVAHGVCVKWKPVTEEDAQEDAEMDGQAETGDAAAADVAMEDPREMNRHASLLGVDYTSDDDDMDEDSPPAKDDLFQTLEPATQIEDAMEASTQAREEEEMRKEKESAADVEPKKEDVDDPDALRIIERHLIKNAQTEATPNDTSGLKTTSKDPLLGSKSSSHSLNGDAEDNKPNAKAKISVYAPTREKIVYGDSDKLFIEPEDLSAFGHPEPSNKGDDLYHALGLDTLFPELQPYGMLEVAPAVVPDSSKKRSGRSSDKDDPNKRLEETSYTKVMPAGQFMTLKPTLLGPLEPATHWKDGKWMPMEEYAVTPDPDSTSRITEESLCELFDFKAKPMKHEGLSGAKDSKSRNDQFWSPNDDLLLKSLIDKYPNNWNLIAECFNGARLTTPSDRRTATDCQERWRAKWGSDLQTKLQLAQDPAAHADGDGGEAGPSAAPAVPTSMTTRGVKRLASSSVSSQQAPNIAAGSEPKKRRRHLLMQETIRKASRKRQEHAQKMLTNQRKPQSQMHDTHVQLTKLPKVTPAELSRRKSEQEAKQMAELQNVRARQDELNAKAGVARTAGGIPQTPAQVAAAAAAQQQQQAQAQQQAALTGQPVQAQAAQLTPQQIHQQLLMQQAAQAQAQAQALQAQAAGQANQANRPGSVAATQANNVNITRISTPSAPPGVGGTRLNAQQILQLQLQQQQRSLSQQMAHGASATAANVNGNATNAAASLSARDPTASPAHGVTTPHVGANSPSPANAQTALAGANATTGAVRVANHYFNAATTAYTTEQVNQMRIHMQLQQQAAALREQQGQQGQGSQGGR